MRFGLKDVISPPVAESLTARFLVVPDIVVNCHPTRIFPLGSGVMTKTVLLKFGVNEPTSPHVDVNLSIRFLSTPEEVVNCHPTRMLSSERTAIVRTVLLRFGVKLVSRVPSVLIRAR